MRAWEFVLPLGLAATIVAVALAVAVKTGQSSARVRERCAERGGVVLEGQCYDAGKLRVIPVR